MSSASITAGRPKVLQLGVIEEAHSTWAAISAIADIIVYVFLEGVFSFSFSYSSFLSGSSRLRPTDL